MHRSKSVAWFIAVCSLALKAFCANAEDSGAYADVNGIRMYYEQHGSSTGVPLVLLHGGGSTIESTFGRILPLLSLHQRIIAVEEQGHGRTSDRAAPVQFDSSADDVAALLAQLRIEQADLFGFSNGASVALQVAIRHPQVVRKLVFASSFAKKSGAPPELWAFMEKADFSNMPPPLKDAFLKVNPDAAKLRSMHDKDASRMRNFREVPDSQLRSIRAKTLVLIGDRDVVTPAHAVELTQLIPDARLMILPGGHGDYLGEVMTTPKPSDYPELTARWVRAFIEEL